MLRGAFLKSQIMKKIITIAILLFIFSCSKEKEKSPIVIRPETRPIVKVMTYNIYGARASSMPPTDLVAVAKVINDEMPDLVALQEVDVYTSRTGKTVHQAKELAALIGMNWFFTKAIDIGGGDYGDAVLSRLPILETRRFSLSVSPSVGGELRSVALIKISKGGKVFYFASTHLDHLAIEESRLIQVEELRKIVSDLNAPIILAGDLNAIPDSKPMTALRSFMTLGCLQQCQFTIPSNNPWKTIDYITYSPINKFNIQSYYVISHNLASDHCPVVSSIMLK